MSRVIFIRPNERFKTDSADQFGSRTYLLNETDPGPGSDPTAFAGGLREKLDGLQFDANDDYVALTGDVREISILMAILGDYEALNVLMFSAKNNQYYRKRLILPLEVE